MSVHVSLDQFEGPLGLLLYLIRKDELDIYDIPIHRITEQYLDQIKKIVELDLEAAGDFVAMAATLLQIKSQMLVPSYNEVGEPIEVEDPRKTLVQRLLEYQTIQEGARLLSQRPWLGREQWARGIRENIDANSDEIDLDDKGLFALISSFRTVMRKIKKKVHKVAASGQSVASRILELKRWLVPDKRVELHELLAQEMEFNRSSHGVDSSSASSAQPKAVSEKLLISFLSVLELTKLGFLRIFQSDVYGPLWLTPIKEISDDVVNRVEEFDAQDPNATAEKWASLAENEVLSEAAEADENSNLNIGQSANVNSSESGYENLGVEGSLNLKRSPHTEANANADAHANLIPNEEMNSSHISDTELALGADKSEEFNDLQNEMSPTAEYATDDDIIAAEKELGLDSF